MSANDNPTTDADPTPDPEIEAMKKKVGGLEKFLNDDDLKTLLDSEKAKKVEIIKKDKETKTTFSEENYKALFDKVANLEKGYSSMIEDNQKSTLVNLQNEILKIRPIFKDDEEFKNASEDTLKLLLKTVKAIQEANPQIHYNEHDDPEDKEDPQELFLDRRKAKENPELYK